MKRFFPFLEWIANYKKSNLGGDVAAGLTVGVMLIPQGMAYSMLAGLPPIYGLYASTIPLIIYALFGTSRQLAVGPVAMVALLISSGVGSLAALGSEEFIALAILLALMVGVIQFAMGVFRLGFVVNFLSHPVIAGFTSAAALIIGFSQLKHLLGIDIPRGKVHETIMNVFENFGQISFPTFLLGASAILILLVIKKVNKRIPGPLIVVLFSILSVVGLGLTEYGVKVVKDVPSGLPTFDTSFLDFSAISSLLPIALTISFIGFMESIAVAKAIQKKHKDYKIDNNQELIGLGLANIFGSFFKAFPVTGGFSRTAVNDQAGAKSGLAAIISASLILVTLLFFTKYFYYLPKAVLSSIIMVAVFGLIDFKEGKHLWKTDKKDFALFMITAIGTLILGIEEGILIGVALSLLLLIYQVSYPAIEVKSHTDFMVKDDGHTLVFRVDARLYFANTNYVKDRILSELKEDTETVILDTRSINSVDSSAAHMLLELLEEMEQEGIRMMLWGLKPNVKDYLEQSHFIEEIGSTNIIDYKALSVDHELAKV